MKLALRSALVSLTICFAGCATTATRQVAFQSGENVQRTNVMTLASATRTAAPAVEYAASEERVATGRTVDRGIPMPEPARESLHALPTPQVPIPFQPGDRGMPAYTGPRGGNAAYWQ